MHLHQCISYRYDDGSTDQVNDEWESAYGVMVFSLGDDAWAFYSDDVDDLKMQILSFGYILPRQAPVHNPYFSAV